MIAAALLIVAAAAVGCLAWLRQTFLIATVYGTSMYPALLPGERLLVRRTSVAALERGQVVVLRTPATDRIAAQCVVKRVAALPGERVPPAPAPVSAPASGPVSAAAAVPARHVFVLGDNPAASVDSRQFGFVAQRSLLGVVVRRLPFAAPPR